MLQPAPLDPVTSAGPREARVAVAPAVELAVRRWDPAYPRSPEDPVTPPAGPSTASSAPLLLVHGLASNARTWDGVAPLLAARGHSVVAVDQRGHGRSDKPDSGYDFERITDDLAALIHALELDRPVVVGQSWGGNVVLELGYRFPDLVRGIVCVDGGTIELSEAFPTWDDCTARLAPPRLVGLPVTEIEAHLRAAHPDWPEVGILGTLANFQVRDDGTVAPWLTFDRHMAILRAMWEYRPSRRLGAIAIPVLLLPADTGRADWTARKRSEIERAAATLRHGRVRWFAPADHDIQSQQPAELADVLHGATLDGFFDA